MKVNIMPVKGKLLVKVNKKSDETKSGLKLVRQGEVWQEETILAEVINKPVENKDVEIGDVVIIRGDAGRWIDPVLVEDNDYIYRIIDEEEIIAKVNKEG
jgi:co-chaperonin GroES (HSP10)